MTLLRKLTAPTIMSALLLASPASLAQNTGINWAWILFGGWFLKLNDLELKGIGGSPDVLKDLKIKASFDLHGYCINPALNQVTGTSAISGIEDFSIDPDSVKIIEKNGKTYIDEIHFDPVFSPYYINGELNTNYVLARDFYYKLWLNCPNPNWYLLNEDPDVDCDAKYRNPDYDPADPESSPWITSDPNREDCHKNNDGTIHYPDRTSVYVSDIFLYMQLQSGDKSKPEQAYHCWLTNPVYTTAPDEGTDPPTNNDPYSFWLDDIHHYWRDNTYPWRPGTLDGSLEVMIDEPFILVHGYDPDPDDNEPGINQYTCE